MSPDSTQHESITLRKGMNLSRTWTVGAAYLYNPSGVPGHDVLSSPSMILEMETTCGDLARAGLTGDLTTVGFHVDVKHVAPARAGASITTMATLTAIDGKKLTFAVEAREGERLVGTGRHRRAIVSFSQLSAMPG